MDVEVKKRSEVETQQGKEEIKLDVELMVGQGKTEKIGEITVSEIDMNEIARKTAKVIANNVEVRYKYGLTPDMARIKVDLDRNAVIVKIQVRKGL